METIQAGAVLIDKKASHNQEGREDHLQCFMVTASVKLGFRPFEMKNKNINPTKKYRRIPFLKKILCISNGKFRFLLEM